MGFYYGKLLAVDKTATILGEDWLHLKDRQNSLGWIKAIDINKLKKKGTAFTQNLFSFIHSVCD